MADNKIIIIASLDIPKSTSTITNDLKTVAQNINAAKALKITISADLGKTQTRIQSQLNTISKNLKLDVNGINIKSNGSQGITNGLKSMQNQAQNTKSAIDSTSLSLVNLEERFKQAITPKLDKSGLIDAERTIESVRKKFEEIKNLKSVSIKGFYSDRESIDSLDKMAVKIQTLSGETRTLNFELDKYSTNPLFYLTSGTSDDSGIKKVTESVQKAQDKLKALRTDLTSTLKTVSQGYLDSNGAKPILDDTHLKNLNAQYVNVHNAIEKLRNVDDTTMASMKANVEKEIDTLRRMIKEYQNAEYAATTLRTKDIGTVKIDQQNKLDEFISKINNSKVPIETLKQDINGLKTSLSSIGDASSFTSYLNQFDNVKSKFESLNALYKGIGNYDKQLDSLANTWKKQGVYVGEVQKTIEGLRASLSNVTTADGMTSWIAGFESKIAVIKDQTSQLKINLDAQIKAQNNIYKIQSDLKNLNPQQNINEISRLKEKLAIEEKTLANLQAQANAFNALISIEDREKYITQETAKAKEKLFSTTAKTEDKAVNQRISDLKKYETEIDKSIKSLDRIYNGTVFGKNYANPDVQSQRQSIQALISEFQRLKIVMQGNVTPESFKQIGVHLDALRLKFKDVQGECGRLSTTLKNDNSMQTMSSRVRKLAADIQSYMKVNTRMMESGAGNVGGTYANQLRGMITQLNNGVDQNTLKNIAGNFANIKSQVRAIGLEGETAFGSLLASGKKFFTWMGTTTVISTFVRTIRGMITNVIALDTALIDLKKTFKGTDTELLNLYFSANKTAKDLGVSTKEILEQASAWSRLGFSSAETAETMAKNSAIFKTISPNMDMDTATDGLVSMMKAFDIETNDVLDGIMSKVNVIGNTFATDNLSIVEAMTRSSSAMAAANNSLEESIALNTASIEITRNAETTANAWKTVSMRLRGYDEQTEELSDDLKNITGEIADLTKAASNGMQGISLFTDESKETYKSTYEIIRDISKIWDELTDKNQAELLEKLAGKRNSQVVASAIKNFKTAEKAMNAMADSEGNAMAEMEIAYESISYQTNKFKESLVGLGQTIFEQDWLKTFVSSGTKVVEVIEKITDKLGAIPVLMGAISVIPALKNAGFLFRTVSDNSALSGQKLVFSLSARKIAQQEAAKQLAIDNACLQAYEQACINGTVTTETFTTTMSGASVAAQNYAQNIKNGVGSAVLYTESQKAAASAAGTVNLATKAASMGIKAMSVAMNMITTTAIMAGISLFVKGIQYLAESSERAIETSKKLREEFDNYTSTYTSERSNLESLRKEYEKLSKGINEHGEVVGLSADEYARYKEITSQILGITPQLITGWDEEGNAISNKNNLLQASIKLLDEEYKRELRNATTRSKNEDVSEGIIEEIKEFNNEASTVSYSGSLGKMVSGFTNELDHTIGYATERLDKIEELRQYFGNIGFDEYPIFGDVVSVEGLYHLLMKDGEKLANSIADENNPIYKYFSDDQIAQMKENADEYFKEAERIKNERDLLYQEYADQINLNIQSEDAYFGLSDNVKAFVNEYVNSLDYAKIQTTDDFLAMTDEAKQFVKTLSGNSDIQEKIETLFSLSPENMPIDKYLSQYQSVLRNIQKYCENNGISMPVDFSADFNDLKTKYESAVSQFGESGRKILSQFFENHSINSVEELKYWDEVTDGAYTAAEAIEKYNSAMDRTSEIIDGFSEKFTNVFENSVSPGLENVDKIKSAMQTLAEGNLLEWEDASELMFDIDTDRILGDFEEIDGKYRLIGNDVSKLIELKDKEVKKQQDSVFELKNEQKEALKVLQTSLSLAKIKLKRLENPQSESDAKYYREQLALIEEIEQEIDNVESNMRDCDKVLMHLNSQLGDTIDKQKVLEEQMKKIQEYADKYAEAMEKQVESIIDKYESEKDVLEQEKDALEEQLSILEEQQDVIEDTIDSYKDVLNVVEDAVDRQIDLLKKQQEAEESAIQAKIDALKEAHEQQEEENSLIEKELTLQQKLRDLEKAKQTKVRTYSESRGWHYDVDKEAVANAQTDVNEAQKDYDKAIDDKNYNDQLDALEKEKDLISKNYDEQIKAYEEYYDAWKAIVDEQSDIENERLAEQLLGVEWREKIKSMDKGILDKYSANYREYNAQLNQLSDTEIANLEKSIKAKESEIKAKDAQIQSWKNYLTQVQNAVNGVKNNYDDYLKYLDDVTLNENSTYEERARVLETFKNRYAGFINDINSLQNQIDLYINVHENFSEARWRTAEFLTQYRDGVLAMQEALSGSATGFGIVNSQWDADLVNAANYARSIDFYSLMGAYSTGGVADQTGLAMLHGTKQQAETIFNAEQSKRLYDMVKTDSFSNLVAQKAINGIAKSLFSNQTINNSSNVGSTIHIHEMVIKADNPTQFHDQFVREIGQYWKIKLAENRVK